MSASAERFRAAVEGRAPGGGATHLKAAMTRKRRTLSAAHTSGARHKEASRYDCPMSVRLLADLCATWHRSR